LKTTIIHAALAAATLAALPAMAQETDADAIPSVETRGVRDPAMMPYTDAYDILTRVKTVGAGHIEFVVRILSATTAQPIPDLEIALQGTTVFEKLPLADNGTLTIPLDAKYVADKADFVTNKKKGTIKAHMVLLPTLPDGKLTYADMDASVTGGKRAMKELMPWYLRLLFGRVHGVKLCYPEAGREIGLATGAPVVANEEKKNPLNGKTVYCGVFDEDAMQAAPQTAVNAPPGYVAFFN
jgi:hypothetical protein